MVTRTLEQCHHVGCVRKLATTGKAADLIGGSTVHDTRRGLALPVGGQKQFVPLSSEKLRDLQCEWKGTIALIVDEYSMLRQKELYWIDERLKQIMGSNHPFGGMAVILSGDPGQIPPVQGRCLWDRSSTKGDDFSGLNCYNSMFTRCIILTEVKRIEQDPGAAMFLKILDNLRNGENTIDEWHTVCMTCLRDSIRHQEWED
jgi:hypothetical protein